MLSALFIARYHGKKSSEKLCHINHVTQKPSRMHAKRPLLRDSEQICLQIKAIRFMKRQFMRSSNLLRFCCSDWLLVSVFESMLNNRWRQKLRQQLIIPLCTCFLRRELVRKQKIEKKNQRTTERAHCHFSAWERVFFPIFFAFSLHGTRIPPLASDFFCVSSTQLLFSVARVIMNRSANRSRN